MKTVTAVIDYNGNTTEEFGGDLVGKCCGPESAEIRSALLRFGVEVKSRDLYCFLPLVKKNEAKSNGVCITNSKIKERRQV